MKLVIAHGPKYFKEKRLFSQLKTASFDRQPIFHGLCVMPDFSIKVTFSVKIALGTLQYKNEAPDATKLFMGNIIKQLCSIK